jgi:hypothetical protein
MASALNQRRLVDQTVQNLIGLRRDMRNNAQTWRAMAAAQSPDLPTLTGYMHSGEYLRRLDWQRNALSGADLPGALAFVGYSVADHQQEAASLRQAALMLQSWPIASYADVTAGCDALLAAVSAQQSIWPE